MIPITNKQTRVTRNTATTTDHIFISTVTVLIKHRSGIIKLIFQVILQLFTLNACEKSKPGDKAQFIYHVHLRRRTNRVIEA